MRGFNDFAAVAVRGGDHEGDAGQAEEEEGDPLFPLSQALAHSYSSQSSTCVLVLLRDVGDTEG